MFKKKQQVVIDKILKWIENIHDTELDIYRYIHRDDKWRYHKINKKWVHSGDNEYGVELRCSKCYAHTAICVKKGIDFNLIANEVECQNCGVKFDFKKGNHGTHSKPED